MSQPRFSIVIPTRERAQTLLFAIRTCLAQNYDNYEIIVCDNCGSPATRETVESFGSPKIKYVRSDVPLAMSDNWELALSHARGEFVTVVGDDDGLLRHALGEADRLIRVFRATVVRWACCYYKWPNYASPEVAHRLSFPFSGRAEQVPSRELLKELIKEPKRYHELPMIYNSFVHRDLIDLLRARTGRVFKAISPDVYSGFAFANLVPEFVSVGRPMGICGTSGHSTGQALVMGAGTTSGIAKDFLELNYRSGVGWNEHVPRIPKSISALIAESNAQVRTNLSSSNVSSAGWTRRDRKLLTSAVLRDLQEHANLSDDERCGAIEKLQKWCADDSRLRAWFKAQVRNEPSPQTRDMPTHTRWNKGCSTTSFDIDASAFGVSDTDGVAALMENLLGATARPIAARKHRPSRLHRIGLEVIPPVIYKIIRASVEVVRGKKLAS